MFNYLAERSFAYIKMNIKDFETNLDSKILSRGLDYYESGNVTSLECEEDDLWVASVEGSVDYTVTVSLSDEGEILDTECDCPYEWSEYCKHQAAVFFALRERLQSAETPKAAKSKSKQNLAEILGSMDKQTLSSIILEFADRDRQIKEELLMRYSKKSDAVLYARNVIKSAIGAVNHHGYIEYGDTRSAIKGADIVLQMANDCFASGDVIGGISICIIVCEEMMHLMEYCDDSDGYVGDEIAEAIELIGKAICSDLKGDANIFDTVFNHALDSMYDGWADWRMDLLSSLVPLCANRVNRDRLEEFILQRQDTEKDNWSVNYAKHTLQNLQCAIIEQFDGETAADLYMEQHLDNSDFRSVIIQKAIADGQYEKAIDLCRHGEEQDSKYIGLVKKWKEFRYTVYEITANTQGIKSLGLELLLNGDFDYYAKLKAAYRTDEWPCVLQEILEITEGKDQTGIYVNILIQEKLKTRLLEYCKKNIFSITLYYEHLLPEYKEDVGMIFVKLINERAARASERKAYKDVCGLIKQYKKACGNTAYIIRDELEKTYNRRPAFLDELSKL